MQDKPLTVFISDLHLSKSEPDIEQRFIALLKKLKNQTNRLYILGDWFDLWVRDSIDIEEFLNLVYELKIAIDGSLKIYFMPGNRDFLLGKLFLAKTGVKLLSDPHTLMLGDKKVLLMHGDRLCTDDKLYQRYMKIIQNPLTRSTLRLIPNSVLKIVAFKIKRATNKSKDKKPAYIMDVNQQAVDKALQDADILIHGHTHQPGVHKHDSKSRLVMSDWSQEAKIVIFDGENFNLATENQI